MVYVYENAGSKRTRCDITVDSIGEGKLRIVSALANRIVVLKDLKEPWKIKYLEDVLHEILNVYRKDSTVFISKNAATEINRYAVNNRYRYAGWPLNKFRNNDAAI